ncbi:MAG TPA: flavin reductase family protein [Terriglobales bacterium]|jgi:flavin reductase (DIM6/NTAB) family NADH-FMN oxidoreductase RutF
MNVRPSELPYSEFYRILISTVAPRPIGWISSLSATGQPNLAPFSFFNAICGQPPLLIFSPGQRLRGEGENLRGETKDTLRNVRETGEFVANLVTYEVAEAMNLTSGEYDPSVNEFELAGLTPRPSNVVKPPCVAESPVNYECKVREILDFPSPPRGCSLVIGEIVFMHVHERHFKEGKLDANSLDLVGRMGGMQYSRTRERFEMARPKVK